MNVVEMMPSKDQMDYDFPVDEEIRLHSGALTDAEPHFWQ